MRKPSLWIAMLYSVSISAMTLPYAPSKQDQASSNSDLSYQILPEEKPCSKRTWETMASYLYWSAREDNLTYAIENGIAFAPLVPDGHPDGKLKAPQGTWHSGLRLEAATIADSQKFERYGFRALWTYFNMQSSSTSKTADPTIFPIIGTLLGSLTANGGSPFLFCNSAKGKWGLQLNEFAINLEYLCQTAPNVSFRPYVGIFGAALRQRFRAFYNQVQVQVPAPMFIDVQMHAINRFWGVGPSIGCAVDWAWTKRFHLIGNAFASGLYGQMNLRSTPVVPQGSGTAFLFSRFVEAATRLRTMFGSQLGLEAGPWSGVSFSVNYEWQWWPQQWRVVSDALPNFFAGNTGRGDLSLQGFTASLKAVF